MILSPKVICKKLISIIYPRDSKVTTNNRFINIDGGSMDGTNWNSSYKKNK